MLRRKKFALGAMAALTVAAVAAGTVTATASTATPRTTDHGVGNVSAPRTAMRASTTATKHYWTAGRMANAKNISTLAVQKGGGPSKLRAMPRRATSGGTPHSVAPTSGSLSPATTLSSPVPQASGYPSQFPRPYTTLVERTNAKVFFTQNGADYVCSGTVVNSDTKHMVNTAGHCVNDGFGDWSYNVMVVPAYGSSCGRCGDSPYGNWYARTLASKTAWVDYGDLNYDMGYIVLKNKRNKGAIVNYLGGRGMAWDQDWQQTFNAMGYPQAAPFKGMSQWRVSNPALWLDDPTGLGETPTVAMESGLTGGSSGGAWDIGLSGQRGAYVNGHNDYIYTNAPDVMYSPYYGDEEYSLFTYTVGLG